MVIIDRIKALAAEKGMKLNFITKQLGLSHTYFADVRNGKNSISEKRLKLIATLLDSSVEYLKGETDNKEQSEPRKARIDVIMDLYEQLTDKEKAEFLPKFNAIINRRRKE